MQNLAGLLLAVLVIVANTGCADGPKTVPVSGQVTINGEPAEGVQVTFDPVNSEELQAASGTVKADGSYELYTGTSGTKGAMVGKYKVMLSDPSNDTSYMDSPQPEKGAEGVVGQSTGRIPADYTPKEVEVTSGGDPINIEI